MWRKKRAQKIEMFGSLQKHNFVFSSFLLSADGCWSALMRNLLWPCASQHDDSLSYKLDCGKLYIPVRHINTNLCKAQKSEFVHVDVPKKVWFKRNNKEACWTSCVIRWKRRMKVERGRYYLIFFLLLVPPSINWALECSGRTEQFGTTSNWIHIRS